MVILIHAESVVRLPRVPAMLRYCTPTLSEPSHNLKPIAINLRSDRQSEFQQTESRHVTFDEKFSQSQRTNMPSPAFAIQGDLA